MDFRAQYKSYTFLQNSKSKVDGSFVATVLETLAVGALYLGWTSITECKQQQDTFKCVANTEVQHPGTMVIIKVFPSSGHPAGP